MRDLLSPFNAILTNKKPCFGNVTINKVRWTTNKMKLVRKPSSQNNYKIPQSAKKVMKMDIMIYSNL